MNDFKYCENLRIRMWEALNISFPEVFFCQVAELLGEKHTGLLFDLLKNKEFSYLPFAILPEFPPDMAQEYHELFDDSKFVFAVNLLRISWIENCLSNRLSESLRDFMAILLRYLRATEKCYRMNLADKVSTCSGSAFREVKKQFRKQERSFMEQAEALSLDEKYIVCCISVLCLEELSDKSRWKGERIFTAQRSNLIAIGEQQ